MGRNDMAIRTLIALLLAALYFAGIVPGIAGSILLVAAIIFLLTSFTGFCPIYTLLGINTDKEKDQRSN